MNVNFRTRVVVNRFVQRILINSMIYDMFLIKVIDDRMDSNGSNRPECIEPYNVLWVMANSNLYFKEPQEFVENKLVVCIVQTS